MLLPIRREAGGGGQEGKEEGKGGLLRRVPTPRRRACGPTDTLSARAEAAEGSISALSLLNLLAVSEVEISRAPFPSSIFFLSFFLSWAFHI